MPQNDDPVSITPAEERELRRVYMHLCNYLPKSKLFASIKPLLDRNTTILTHKKNPEAVKIFDSRGQAMSPEEVETEHYTLTEEIERLRAEIQKYNNDPGAKIHPADLSEALKSLGKKATKKEIEEMIWEVDENLDECVEWDEFRLMYNRNVMDTTGLEPNQLFNIAQFLTYDKDFRGKVTVDDTMSMLYARYGRDKLESKVKEMFGHDLGNSNGDKELTFLEYLEAVNNKELRKRQEMKQKAKKKG